MIAGTFNLSAQCQQEEVPIDTIPYIILVLSDNTCHEFEINNSLRLINEDGNLKVGYQKQSSDTEDNENNEDNSDDKNDEDDEDGTNDDSNEDNDPDLNLLRAKENVIFTASFLDASEIVSIGIAYKTAMPTDRKEIIERNFDDKTWSIYDLQGQYISGGNDGQPRFDKLEKGKVYIITCGNKSLKYIPLK